MSAVNFHVLAAIAAVYLVGLVTPGPNLLIVSQSAMRYGAPYGLATAAGVVTVNAIWCTASLFGLSLILATTPWLAGVLRYLGAGYLAWIAYRLWRDAAKPTKPRPLGGGGYRAGLATNLSNIKAVVFYSSILSAAAPAGTTLPTLIGALLVVVIFSSLFYSFVAVMLSRPTAVATYLRAKVWIDRCCSVMMLGFATAMLLGH